MDSDALMRLAPVIAVVVLHDVGHAEPLARALAKGGVKAVEITLRTPGALECIRRAAAAVPEAVVGAGTLRGPEDLQRVIDAGARFAVSPGLTPALLTAARDAPIPLLPGIASASELMTGLEHGYTRFKFFPAEAAGGRPLLQGLGGPFPDVAFCPTGGIGPDNAASYLALPNVLCVGGSWVAPDRLVQAGDWEGIERLAREAVERLARA